ncbi:hypothetical protein [Butyrivibrio sp. VCB2006]|uniref:hypothetical protein n=1 Tax=Butyrivibrio sp. VCB2006 TaxID=1280679 RepID=UPI0004922D30|nr:hypothetical protein [Butyrivibrio sp. VCB2006]
MRSTIKREEIYFFKLAWKIDFFSFYTLAMQAMAFSNLEIFPNVLQVLAEEGALKESVLEHFRNVSFLSDELAKYCADKGLGCSDMLSQNGIRGPGFFDS